MRYTRVKTVGGKTTWTFVPPRDVREAGICEHTVFHDGRAARYEIPRLIDMVDKYRKGEIREGKLSVDSLFVHLRNHYINSDYFRQLASRSQKSYEGMLNILCDYKVKGKPFGQYKLHEIDTALCREVYQQLVKSKSIDSANSYSRILSVVFNYAMGLELFLFNPIARVKKLRHEPTTYIWTQEQVEQFLEEGYKEFDTRNVTLLLHMCYEWAQRPVDIRMLTWEQIDWDTKTVTITQTKRKATVYLPIEEPLLTMLNTQWEEWGFQPWVVPYTIPSGTVYKPMSQGQMSTVYKKVRDKAGLPSELKLGAMRATAITEMVEAGVDVTGIKQVSGHKSLDSITPYVKNTKRGALRALSQRRKNNE